VVFVGFIPRAEAVPRSASPRTPAASSQDSPSAEVYDIDIPWGNHPSGW
jgi:hypothetical protein